MFESKYMNYKSFGRCIYLTNGVIELIATVDIGPRIVRYGYVGGDNILYDNAEKFADVTDSEFEKYFGKGSAFKIYGGHRLWLSPEYYPDMYYPDNEPVKADLLDNGVLLTPPVQKENKVQLSMKITLDPDDTNVTVEHRAENLSERVKECALWAITVCATGGTEIIPMNTHDSGFLPNNKVAIWPYTDIRKENIYLGKNYSTVRQPETERLKLGFELKNGTVYYCTGDDVFIKSYYPHYPTGVYPDGNISFETYSCDFYTEMETLGELKKLAKGETACHVERWSLCKKPCEFYAADEASIDAFVNKL